jgi:lipid-A-disaccharide synthase
MGIAEVLPKVPLLRRRLREVEDHALASGPDAVVTIDSPGFNFRLGRRLKGQGIPLVHYVAPSVWAWKPGRARKVAQFLDHLLTLLPFEPPYFEVEGLRSTFVGHSVLETGAGHGDGPAFRARHDIAAGDSVVCVLPGSRNSETSRLLRPFGAAMRLVAAEVPNLTVVVPAVPHLDEQIRAAVRTWGVRATVVEGAEKYDAMAASNVALAASGTVALELALAKLPTVIAYRMHPLTWMMVLRLAKTPWVNLVNVLLKRSVVPELLQYDCTPDRLAANVLALLRDPVQRSAQIEATVGAIAMLTPPGGSPSRAAAQAVLDVVMEKAQGA